jgi:DNA-binding NarL/FixJ family response regulator
MLDDRVRQIGVVVADEDDDWRAALVESLERDGFAIRAEELDATGAVDATLREEPDLCLLAAALPGGALLATSRIANECPATQVVVVAADPDEEDCLTSLEAGASAYLAKDASPDHLVAALRDVVAGIPAIPRGFQSRLLGELGGP